MPPSPILIVMLNGLRRLSRILDLINEKIGQTIIYLGVVLTVIVVYEVGMRYLFNRPTIWGMEVTQFILCALIALGGGYVLLLRGHINVDIFYRNFGVRTKAITNLITSLLLFFYLVFFIYETWHAAMLSMSWKETSGSGWNPPIYPVLFIMPVGGALMLLQSISRFIKYFIQAITGEQEIEEHIELFDKKDQEA